MSAGNSRRSSFVVPALPKDHPASSQSASGKSTPAGSPKLGPEQNARVPLKPNPDKAHKNSEFHIDPINCL